MLSFVTPWVMGVAVVAALAIAALHLLSVRQPPLLLLPTARFVDPGDARSVARRPRPNDLLLLALRVFALLLAGAALAGARCHAGGPERVRLVVADSSFRADSVAWWPHLTTAMAELPDAQDRSARVIPVWTTGLHTDPGAALVAAQREAARVAAAEPNVEQIALTVVLPAQVRSTRGWRAWRASWPGAVQVMSPDGARLSDPVNDTSASGQPALQPSLPTTDTRASFAVVVQSPLDDDPVAAAFAGERSVRPIMISRDSLRSRSAAPAAGDGVGSPTSTDTVHVHWPSQGAPVGWKRRITPDTAGGIAARERVLVAPFARHYRWQQDSLMSDTPVAWWSDGEVAATERTIAGGCERYVYLPVDVGSDVLQSSAAVGLRTALTAPCGGGITTADLLQEPSAGGAINADAFRGAGTSSGRSEPWWLTPLALAVALITLLTEQVLRRREVTP